MYKRITNNKAKSILKDQETAILIDIRDIDSFNYSHDKKAMHINENNLSDFITNTAKNMPILVMCYHGNSSQNMASFLIKNNFTEVYSIDGGYEDWNK